MNGKRKKNKTSGGRKTDPVNKWLSEVFQLTELIEYD